MANTNVESYLRQSAFPTIWCPGCGHGIVMKASIRAIQKMGWEKDQIIAVSGIGCSSRAPSYGDFYGIQTTHGRAIAYATGMKLARPDMNLVLYLGDGDCCAIGGNHLIHAAKRNLDMTVIVMNNHIYGMTGGQMAPTSLPGQVTQTTPYGRDVSTAGYPVRICEMLSTLDGVAYAERVSVDCVPNIRKAKAAIKKAFENQVNKKGFSIVEVLSSCPTNWGLTPIEALDWLRDNMIPYYPLGVYKDITGGDK